MIILTQSKQKLFSFGVSDYIEIVGNSELWIRGQGIQGRLGKYESNERASEIYFDIMSVYRTHGADHATYQMPKE